MKIALAQMDVKAGSPETNFSRMKEMINDAKKMEVNIICFSEMSIGGYLIGDLWLDDDYCRYLMSFNEQIREASDGIAVIFGNVFLDERETLEKDNITVRNCNKDGRKRRYNAAYAFYNREPMKRFSRTGIIPEGVQFKTLLPNYRYFDDERYFSSPLDLLREELIDRMDVNSPFEMIIGEGHLNFFRIGVELCEDMWWLDYNYNPTFKLRGYSDIIINISSSPFTCGKNKARDRRVKNVLGNSPLGIPFGYVNCVGAQNNGKNILVFDGASTLYGPDGRPKILANADYEEELLVFDIDNIPRETAKRKNNKDIARKYQAIIRGIKHMTEISGVEKYIIALSGGIDSAVVSVLLVDALGKENVVAINMPTKYNSNKTKNAAKRIAKNLGIQYISCPIEELVEVNTNAIMRIAAEIRKESELKDIKSLTAENLQAKIRGASILSNIAGEMGCLFTSNGNKIEVALGYATLYGDWGGAIAPIGDLTKREVYELAEYLNSIHRKNPIPKDLASGEIRPSAELKEAQFDPIRVEYHSALIDKLLDYKKISPTTIMKWYYDGELADKLGVNRKYIPDKIEFIDDLKWFCGAMRTAVFKRVQAPPIIVLTKTAFGYDLRESILPRLMWTGETENLEQMILRR